MASDSPTREIPQDGIVTPHGRLYRPLHEGFQILVLIGAFLGSLVVGWLVGMAPGDLSDTAQTLAFVPFLMVLFFGYAAWVARLNALAFDLIGRSVLKALLLLILRRQKPKSIKELIPSEEKLQDMAVRAQRAGASFGPASWPVALGAGIGAMLFDSTLSALALFALLGCSTLAWGYALAFLGRRGYLPIMEEG